MASTSSKALPFISIAAAFALAVISALGFGDQVDKVIAVLGVVLPITAGGGLVNKAIDAVIAKRNEILTDPAFTSTVTKIAKEVKAAGDTTTTSTTETTTTAEVKPATTS